MPKFGTTRWAIRRDREGGGFEPPTHPNGIYSVISERYTRNGWEEDSFSHLDYARTCEWMPAWVRERAGEIIDAWVAPSIDDRDVQLWIRRCWSHWHNCYFMGEGHEILVLQSRPFGNLPTVADYDTANMDPFARHYIRQFYPEYEPQETDQQVDCAACGHHVNAHTNGTGGECTVIKDQPSYKAATSETAKRETLCLCPTFQLKG